MLGYCERGDTHIYKTLTLQKKEIKRGLHSDVHKVIARDEAYIEQSPPPGYEHELAGPENKLQKFADTYCHDACDREGRNRSYWSERWSWEAETRRIVCLCKGDVN